MDEGKNFLSIDSEAKICDAYVVTDADWEIRNFDKDLEIVCGGCNRTTIWEVRYFYKDQEIDHIDCICTECGHHMCTYIKEDSYDR